MSDELTQQLPNDAPDTEPTILTLMERLRVIQEVMDRRHLETHELMERRHVETQELIASVRDDINQRVQQTHELLVSRIDLLRTETDGHFRKQDHVIHALNDNVLDARGNQRELFERIAVLEEKAS